MKKLLILCVLAMSSYARAQFAIDLDFAHTVKQTIGTNGGSLSTIDAAGQKITLTIPPKAILKSIEVSMTPLKAITGIDLSNGIKGAVHLEPEGLHLWEKAELIIELNSPLTAQAELPFSYRQDNTSSQAQIMFVSDKTLRFPIFHFSGYGVAEGSVADWNKLSTQNIADPAGQLGNDMAILVKLHQDGKFSSEEEYQAAVSKLLADAKNGVYQNLINQVGTGPNCTAEKSRFRKINSINRMVSIMNSGEAWPGVDVKKADLVFKRCVNELEHSCADRHDPALSQNILGLAREAAVMGDDTLSEYATAAATRCGTFQVEINSQLDIQKRAHVWVNHLSHFLTSWFYEDMLGAGGGDRPQDPIITGDYNLTPTSHSCKTTWKFASLPIIYNQLKVAYTERSGEFTDDVPFDLPSVDLTDFVLRVQPGNIDENTHTECKDSPPADFTFHYWLTYFDHFHTNERNSGYYWIKNFELQPIGSPLIAQKEYQQTSGDGGVNFTEKTTIKIVHAPGAK